MIEIYITTLMSPCHNRFGLVRMTSFVNLRIPKSTQIIAYLGVETRVSSVLCTRRVQCTHYYYINLHLHKGVHVIGPIKRAWWIWHNLPTACTYSARASAEHYKVAFASQRGFFQAQFYNFSHWRMIVAAMIVVYNTPRASIKVKIMYTRWHHSNLRTYLA